MFNTQTQAPKRQNGLSLIKDAISISLQQQQQEQEELKAFRLQVFEQPMKFVDAIIPQLPPKQQEVMIYGQKLQGAVTVTNDMIVAKQNANELLALLQELKADATNTYSQNISGAYYSMDKKTVADKALNKVHEFTQAINVLSKAI